MNGCRTGVLFTLTAPLHLMENYIIAIGQLPTLNTEVFRKRALEGLPHSQREYLPCCHHDHILLLYTTVED
jgi:hypothetical protein